MGKLSVQDLAAILVEKNGLDQEEATRFVSTIFEIIQDGIDKDKLVKVKGLGTFKIVEVEARESVNVNTGERVLIDGHSKVTFTPDATMKELVNKPFSSFETVALNDGVEFEDTPTPKSAKDSNQSDDDDEGDDTQNEDVEEPVKVIKQPAPSVEQPAPSVEQPVPSVEQPVPSVEQPKPTPVVEQPAPVIEEPKPASVVEQPAPIVEEPKPTPVVEQPAPVVEQPVQEPVAVQPKEEPVKVAEPVNTPQQQTIKDAVLELGAQKAEPVQTEEETDEEEEPQGTQWGNLILALLIGLIIGCVAGFYIGKNDIMSYFSATSTETTEQVQEVEQPKPLVADSLAASADTTKVGSTSTDTAQLGSVAIEPQTPAQPAAEPAQSVAEPAKPAAKPAVETDDEGFNYKKYEAMDARVRTGAYYIAGTDQIVAAREGDTVERISRRYLGTGLSCYVEVYNELSGKTVLKEGQTIKIPKLKLKKYLKKK